MAKKAAHEIRRMSAMRSNLPRMFIATCSCGWRAENTDDEQLSAEVRKHSRTKAASE